MSQKYNGNTKRPKPKKKSARDLKNLCIFKRASSPGESAAEVTYLSMRIHLKLCSIFSLRVRLNGS